MEPPMAMTHDTIAKEIDDIAKGSAQKFFILKEWSVAIREGLRGVGLIFDDIDIF